MGGLSVNKKIERKYIESFETSKTTSFICGGSCSLHIANNSFGGIDISANPDGYQTGRNTKIVS